MIVNRIDVWGGYHSLTDRTKIITWPDGTKGPLGPTTTRPAKSKRGQIFLTLQVLQNHFAALGPPAVVGLHTTSKDNTSLWGAIEIDWHGEGSTAPEVNLAAALAWFELLCKLGFRPLLSDSN